MTVKSGLRAMFRGQRPSACESDDEDKPETLSVPPQPEPHKETSMPDTDIESRLADARSQAATEATQLANERFLTALNDGNVKSNLSLATTLLANAEMSAEAVIQACAAAEDEKQAAIESAKSQAGTQQPDLKDLQESAHADEGNQDVSAEGEEQPKPSAKTTIGDRMAARKAKKGE